MVGGQLLLICVLFSLLQQLQASETTTIYPNRQDRVEIEHYGFNPVGFLPWTTTLSPKVGEGYEIPDTKLTPDFRLPEQMSGPKILEPPFTYYYLQYNRPYRFTSSGFIYHYYKNYFFKKDEAQTFSCYCTTAYKHTVPLAGCAVLTSRHILTTASSTERILRLHKNSRTIGEVLGVWYERGFSELLNASQYAYPVRIHYHPWYTGLDNVNNSHPVPIYDLSVWALNIPTWTQFVNGSTPFVYPYAAWETRTVFCKRASSNRFYPTSPALLDTEDYWVFGYQFIRAYNRYPNPYIKYGVRTRDIVPSCPKKEWGWYLCMGGRWAPLGIDSGAALHRTTVKKSSPTPDVRVDGLIAMGAFSMNLRSNRLVHYFTVIETHPVLDFLYSAYMGRLPYVFLDYRFYNTQWGAPLPKPWAAPMAFVYPTALQIKQPGPEAKPWNIFHMSPGDPRILK